MRKLEIFTVVTLLGAVSCHSSDEGNPSTDLPVAVGNEQSSAPPPAQIRRDLPGAAAPLEVGAATPSFRLQTATETLQSDNALHAGPLVLVFYIGEFCIYCRRQLEQIESRIGDFRSAGATVWAISADTVSTSAALARSLHLSFPLPSDPELSVVRAFGVESSGSGVALPSVFVVGRDGHVVYRHVGANQADRAGVDEILQAVRTAGRDQ